MLVHCVATAAVFAAAGCADGGVDGRLSLTTRDSAGIEIVEIQGDPWTAPAWASLDSTGAMTVVPDDSRPETLFGRLRGALRLADGRIAVLDIERHIVQVFAPDGAFLFSRGRRGQGPGELSNPWRLIRAAGDSVGVYDMDGHLELISLADGGSRRIRVPRTRDGGMAQILGSFSGGDYLAILNEFPGRIEEGTIPLFSSLEVMTATGGRGSALGRYQSTQFTFRKVNGELRQVETLFWAEPGMAVLPSGFAWCQVAEIDCQLWSRTGEHVRTIRAAVEKTAVTDDAVDDLVAMRLGDAATAGDSVRIRNALRDADRADHMPVASLIRGDSRGRLWIRPFLWHMEPQARWVVLEPTGAVLGTVTLPSSLEVYDIGEDYILGVDRDEEGVQWISMSRFHSPR